MQSDTNHSNLFYETHRRRMVLPFSKIGKALASFYISVQPQKAEHSQYTYDFSNKNSINSPLKHNSWRYALYCVLKKFNTLGGDKKGTRYFRLDLIRQKCLYWLAKVDLTQAVNKDIATTSSVLYTQRVVSLRIYT